MIVVGVLGGLSPIWRNVIKAFDEWLEQPPEVFREDTLHETIALLRIEAKKHKVPLDVVIKHAAFTECTQIAKVHYNYYKIEVRDTSKHDVEDSSLFIEVDMDDPEKFESALHNLHVLFYRKAAELGYTSPYLSNLDQREPL